MKILPAGASVLDFAFEIHSDIGKRCIGAKVNHKIEPISYRLRNGDQVEILTSKKQKPADDWLQYAITAKAKSTIKDVLKSERRRIMAIGKTALEEIFKEKKVAFNSHNVNKVLEFFKIGASNDLFYSIGVGNFKLTDIDYFTRDGDNIVIKDAVKHEHDIELAIKNKLVSNSNLWMFGDGEKSVDYNLAQCCKPIPGDDVFGFVNKNKEVEIHRTNCPKAINTIAKYGYDIVRTKWTKQHQIAFLTGLKMTGIDDVGVMQKISNVISGDLKVNMQSISIDTRDGIFTGIIKVFVKDTSHLQELMDMLRSLDGILSVARYEEETAAV